MRRGREHGHVHPDFGDHVLGGAPGDARRLVQAGNLSLEGGAQDRDLGVKFGDLGGVLVGQLQHPAQEGCQGRG